jgi:tetratricopeptide (TPR) repeat protein
MVLRLGLTKKMAIGASLAVMVMVNWMGPGLAGDPFRKNNPRPIGDKTEAAFNAIFKQGNYLEAKKLIVEATEKEPQEPLSHAMRASLAFTDQDWNTLKTYSEKTKAAAKQMQGSDPLKGYMDLILAVNLPFSSPQEAIQRLETYGSPDYLVDRGIALAYRDLKQYDQALRFIDNALKATPDNPELMYLKGQILRIQGNTDKNTGSLKLALDYFNNALKKQEQLPESVKKQLNREHRKVQEEIKSLENTANR